MDITRAIININGQPFTTIESAALASLVGDEDSDGACLENLRHVLYNAFLEIHEDEDVEVIFPELEAL